MSQLIVSQVRSLFERQKDDSFPDINSATFLDWINFINNKIYFELSAIDESRFMTEFIYDIQSDIASYSLPSDCDFSALQYDTSGVFETQSGSEFAILRYDNETGAFTVGNVVTGTNSGAYGTIVQLQDEGTTGYFVLSNVTGVFENDEPITDTGTGVAEANGVARPFNKTNTKLLKQHSYSQSTGYNLNSTDIKFTPLPKANAIYVLRYLPLLTELTGDTSETLFDSRFSEAIVSMTIEAYEIWDQGDIGTATIIATRAIKQMMKNYKREPQIYIW